MTDAPHSLSTLGDALQRAATADLASADARRRRRRRTAVTLLAAAVILPGGAIAANRLIGTDEVERSIPAGTLSLDGTEPTCTVVREDVEFDCTLARAPRPEVSDWKGHRRADGRRHQARQRRLPVAAVRRAPLALLPRRGGGASADHRRRFPRRVRAVAGRRLTVGIAPLA